MSTLFRTSLVLALVSPLAAQPPGNRDRGSDRSSRPLTARQRAEQQRLHDRIVEEFILYDIGQVKDPAAIARIKKRFGALRADAIPSLVRGLNYSARRQYSCPITAISGKLSTIISRTDDPEALQYILRNLTRQAGNYTASVQAVHRRAEQRFAKTMGHREAQNQLQRRKAEGRRKLAYVPGQKLTDLPRRQPAGGAESGRGLPELTVKDNARNLGNALADAGKGTKPTRRGPRSGTLELRKLELDDLVGKLSEAENRTLAVKELYRRASTGKREAVARHWEAVRGVMTTGNPTARQTAARLLGQLRVEDAVPALIDRIEDPDAGVRSAATTALTRITRQLFGPAEGASPEQVATAVANWRRWWAAR